MTLAEFAAFMAGFRRFHGGSETDKAEKPSLEAFLAWKAERA